MSSPANPQEASPGRPRRSAGRWAVVGFFALLTLGFILRLVQNAYLWLQGNAPSELNYKVLAVWCLVYALVCGGIAAFAFWLPVEDEDGPAE